MPTFRTEDAAELHYKVEGKDCGKPSMIFIHGWCSNLNHWEEQSAYFRDSHRILRMDRRGMGKSTTPGSGHTPQRHADDIAALARHEGFTNTVTIAHAGGGPVGVAFSHAYPDLVRAFILVDSAVTPAADLDNPKTGTERFYAEMVEKLTAPDGETYFRELYASFFGPQADRVMVETAVGQACRTPVDVRVKEIRLMAADSVTSATAMSQPTLVMVGPWMADAFPQAADPNHLKSCFKQVEFARAIGAGHFLQLEVPDQVNAFIKSFMSRLAA